MKAAFVVLVSALAAYTVLVTANCCSEVKDVNDVNDVIDVSPPLMVAAAS